MEEVFFAPDTDCCYSGLAGSSTAWFLGSRKERCLVISPSLRMMDRLTGDLRAYYPHLRIYEFPSLPGTPYVPIPIHEKALALRKKVVLAVLQDEWDIIVTMPQAMLETFPEQSRMMSRKVECHVGDEIEPDVLMHSLITMGFIRVDMVSAPGEFARRGAILDIFAPNEEFPVRIEFWDNEVDDIRSFSPISQRSQEKMDCFSFSPHELWQIESENVEYFSRKGAELWNQSSARRHFLTLIRELQEKGSFQGHFHWAPLLFQQTEHFWDLIQGKFQIILDHPEKIDSLFSHYVEQISIQEHEAKSAHHIFADSKFLFQYASYPHIDFPDGVEIISIEEYGNRKPSVTHFETYPYREHILPNLESPEFADLFAEHRILIYFQSDVLIKRFMDFYPHLNAKLYKGSRFPRTPGVFLFHGALSTGFQWPEKKLFILSERDLWPDHPRSSSPKGTRQWIDTESLDLKQGDLVVHEDHGIGRFEGLQDIHAGGGLFEMLTLTYKNDARLHLSIGQLEKIERLSADGEHAPPLDVLGGVRWQQIKLKAKKSLEEMTNRLLGLYAARSLTQRTPCAEDDFMQTEFEQAFEFVPTPDQLTSFQDIRADLTSGKPMDRLLVGDVGFGKTEVAMRMMFKLVTEGYQVALLCPTTVLAFQHYLTVQERFRGFPVNIAFLSRLLKKKERDILLQSLRDGNCDIVIGTHRLFSRDVAFNRLGGLIVDEEQRFGVSHKEKIKEMRKDVHVLSMSATPIPRTLNMAFSGIRDISIIRTPPRNRLAITTTVTTYNERLIRNAIDFELSRGGQVYFIHNEIKSMPEIRAMLESLFPKAGIGMAHGKMNAVDLENIMLKFIQNKLDILLATTLVENGMDVPNANTMIINRANRFGLGQLYQLRGRVGRSEKPAYAYLLTPLRGRISDQAKKRLTALEEFASLGSGFRLAALDLEIRGAGNMLGSSQSGHIQAIGYQLYMKMMREAKAKLRGKPEEIVINPILNLRSPSCIPKSYIEDGSKRLGIYKKIFACQTREALIELREEIRDCYGHIPDPMELLIDENLWRLELIPHKILSIDREGHTLKVRFHSKASLNLEHIKAFLDKNPGTRLLPNGTFNLQIPQEKSKPLLESARELLVSLLEK